jgi:AcrR family transcriptional regulator
MHRGRAHHPPKQARSRESLRRLLDAAEAMLEKHGAEGATLPRIAKEAGLAPASVYRRFRDKDALMAAVFDRFADMNAKELAAEVDTKAIRKIGIRAFSRQWIAAMIKGLRTRTGLVRAALLYSQQHRDAPFVRRKEELEVQGFERLAGLLLLWRRDIRHPDPEYAVRYAIVTVALHLRELIVFDNVRLFERILPLGDDRLREELPRVFLRYLGVKGE